MSRWADLEIESLEEMYKEEVSVKEISFVLNRSEHAIRNKAYQLKITNNVEFTPAEIEYIKKNYDTKNLREISEHLGRGFSVNICRLAKRLGLTDKNRSKVRHKNTPDPINNYRFIDGKWTMRKYDSETDRRQATSESMKEWHKNNEHPRGMLGKTHSIEYRKKRSELTKAMWTDQKSYLNSEEHRQKLSERMSKQMVDRIKKNPKSVYTNARGGTREDLGFYVRSRWEANVSRYIKFLVEKGEIYKWEYEPDTFWFENIKKGTRSYTPDFKIWETETSDPIYWEVKGYMDAKSKTRMKLMDKYYSGTEIKLIMEKEYKEISERAGLINSWEF